MLCIYSAYTMHINCPYSFIKIISYKTAKCHLILEEPIRHKLISKMGTCTGMTTFGEKVTTQRLLVKLADISKHTV